MAEKNCNKNRVDLIRHIYDWNQNLIQMADTKVGILLAINAIIISISTTLNLRNDVFPNIVMSLAIILSVLSSFMLILTIFPRTSSNIDTTVIFYEGILKHSREDYISKMMKMSEDELFTDYVNNIYTLASIQKKKYYNLRIGILLLFAAIFLIALFFILQNING